MSDGDEDVGRRDVCVGCDGAAEDTGDGKTVVGDGVADGANDVDDGTCNCGRVTLSDKFGTVSLVRTLGAGLLRRRMVVVSIAPGANVVAS